MLAQPTSYAVTMNVRTALALALAAFTLFSAKAHAIELKISNQALERTLNKQLFTQDGRYYFRGNPGSPCFAYAEAPQVSFNGDRIVVHVKAHAKLGTTLHGACLGVSLNTDADVSFVPDAQGQSIGFRDARIEHLSESPELNFFLEPFLRSKLPQQMKVNAATLLRQLLTQSKQSIGYDMQLDDLKIHSMQVQGPLLAVDFDGDVSVY
jgi:hypothetical protein